MDDKIDWQEIFRTFPDGLMVTDSDFRIQFVNSAFRHLLQNESLKLKDAKCYEMFPGYLCHTSGCPLVRVKNTQETQIFFTRGHCKIKQQGQLVAASALLDRQGNFAGLLEKVSDAGIFQYVQTELRHSQERMRKTMGAIIQAMSMTIEKRDPYTAGHQRRVAKLCRAIATELGFSWDRIQGLRMAAAIHDLGKILVPAGILNKPGPMSEPEMAIIRMHPFTAYDILKGIQFPWPLAEIIYQHHERMDGSGYPRQLKGDQILLEARILSVADVVESMSTFRPYRPTIGVKEALMELRRQRAIQFDPKVVDVCILLLTKKDFDFETKAWQRYRTNI
jgi:HD-GYP domain-containing protein (c-di-GMP phosphodiesterase class II)